MQDKRQSKILVVDDEAVNVEVLRAWLEHAGYAVVAASDGNEAISMAESERPDLILLDVIMPQLNGFRVCKRLKASEETRAIPIVFLTGADFKQAQDRAIESGADGYLAKPIGSQELLGMVRAMLDKR